MGSVAVELTRASSSEGQVRAEEMALQLRAHTAVADDWTLALNTQVGGGSRSEALSSTPVIDQFPPTESGRSTSLRKQNLERLTATSPQQYKTSKQLLGEETLTSPTAKTGDFWTARPQNCLPASQGVLEV